MQCFLYYQSVLHLCLISYSEDIRNPKKIFMWNCEKQNTFIEKGRGNDCIPLVKPSLIIMNIPLQISLIHNSMFQ